jgi:hypothetical protein
VAASWVRDMQTAYTSGLSGGGRPALPARGREEHAAQTGAPMVVMAADGPQVPTKKALKRVKRG